MRKAARAALCLLVAALVPTGLWATTAVEMSTDDMAHAASLIVSGRVTNVQSTWVDRDLVTLATISVSEVLKGQAGSEITVVIPGGVDMNRPIPIAVSVPAAPQFSDNESTLLFLVGEDQVQNSYAVVGFSQGKFTLEEVAADKMARQDTSDLNLQRSSGTIVRGGAKAVPYEQLKKQILRTLAPKPE
jgi:hypothetical protein